MGKRVLITGANGMIGQIILHKCLEDREVREVITITRKELHSAHPKLKSIIHSDFMNYNSLIADFEDIDICYYCLGVYTGAVPKKLFFEITVDYTKAFAQFLYEKSPDAHFCFLSGMGADRTEKSKMAFAKAKGMAENFLLQLGFGQLAIFRPGYIYPVQKRIEPNFFYVINRKLYPLLKWIYPNIGLNSDQLASSMYKAGFEKVPKAILENKDIIQYLSSLH